MSENIIKVLKKYGGCKMDPNTLQSVITDLDLKSFKSKFNSNKTILHKLLEDEKDVRLTEDDWIFIFKNSDLNKLDNSE